MRTTSTSSTSCSHITTYSLHTQACSKTLTNYTTKIIFIFFASKKQYSNPDKHYKPHYKAQKIVKDKKKVASRTSENNLGNDLQKSQNILLPSRRPKAF